VLPAEGEGERQPEEEQELRRALHPLVGDDRPKCRLVHAGPHRSAVLPWNEATLTPKPLGSIRLSPALAADPVVAPPSRDGGHAPSSLLGLSRDDVAIIRSTQAVSA